MKKQSRIIKQPDGLYALWSPIVDNFVLLDATQEEMLEYFIEEAVERVKDNWERSWSIVDQTTDAWYARLEFLEDVNPEGFNELKKLVGDMATSKPDNSRK